jgi:hypothetical protein
MTRGRFPEMLYKKHPSARCRYCAEPLYYGLKDEATGWKVHYCCLLPNGCGREFSLGRIGLESVDTKDDAHERAEAFAERLNERFGAERNRPI